MEVRATIKNIQISKIGVAQRQLDAAIRLFFAGEDPLAVHTTAAAAFTVLRDLLLKNNQHVLSDEAFRTGLLNLARRYANGSLSDEEKVLVENSRLKEAFDPLLDDVRAQGDSFDPTRFEVQLTDDERKRMFPNETANFLKHADRNPGGWLPLDRVDNQRLLMSACSAWLTFMGQPTVEIMTFVAFWAAINDGADDVAPNLRGFVTELQGIAPAERKARCARFIRDYPNG